MKNFWKKTKQFQEPEKGKAKKDVKRRKKEISSFHKGLQLHPRGREKPSVVEHDCYNETTKGLPKYALKAHPPKNEFLKSQNQPNRV